MPPAPALLHGLCRHERTRRARANEQQLDRVGRVKFESKTRESESEEVQQRLKRRVEAPLALMSLLKVL